MESRVFSKQGGKTKAMMDQMVILSLYTDGQGTRRDEFSELRDRLTGTASNPVYAILDPFENDKVLYTTDYNTAINDELFGKKLGSTKRRFERALKTRGFKPEETK